VWATDRLDPSLREVAAFSGGYLESIERPLDVPRAGVVLDPFGGSGALSFEALSRGAHHAYLFEIDPAGSTGLAPTPVASRPAA